MFDEQRGAGFFRDLGEARAQQVALLREELRDAAAAIFQRAAGDGDAERHFGGVRGHAQRVEQAGQVRIVAVVEHDEAGIDRHLLPADAHQLRIGVAARAGLGLEQRDRAALAQQPRGRQAGDAGADDRDAGAGGAVMGHAAVLLICL